MRGGKPRAMIIMLCDLKSLCTVILFPHMGTLEITFLAYTRKGCNTFLVIDNANLNGMKLVE